MGLFNKKEKPPVFCEACGQKIEKVHHKCPDGVRIVFHEPDMDYQKAPIKRRMLLSEL